MTQWEEWEEQRAWRAAIANAAMWWTVAGMVGGLLVFVSNFGLPGSSFAWGRAIGIAMVTGSISYGCVRTSNETTGSLITTTLACYAILSGIELLDAFRWPYAWDHLCGKAVSHFLNTSVGAMVGTYLGAKHRTRDHHAQPKNAT